MRPAPRTRASGAAPGAARSGSRALPSGHGEADRLDRRGAGVEVAAELALVDDDDPVGEREDLVQVLAEEKDRDAVGGRLAQVGVHGLDRPDVESPCRGGRDEYLRLRRELPAENELLQ